MGQSGSFSVILSTENSPDAKKLFSNIHPSVEVGSENLRNTYDYPDLSDYIVDTCAEDYL